MLIKYIKETGFGQEKGALLGRPFCCYQSFGLSGADTFGLSGINLGLFWKPYFKRGHRETSPVESSPTDIILHPRHPLSISEVDNEVYLFQSLPSCSMKLKLHLALVPPFERRNFGLDRRQGSANVLCCWIC